MRPELETIENDTGSSFLCQRRSCHSFAEDHSWHFHPEYELLWVIKSEGSRFVGDSIHHFQAGDLVLLGPNLPHCWYNNGKDQDRFESPEWIVVQFKPDCFGAGFLDLPESRSVRKLLERAHRGLYIYGETSRQVTKKLVHLTEEQGLTKLISLLHILNLLAQSEEMEPLVSFDYKLDSDVKPSSLKRIEEAHRYVHEHINKQISQTEVAYQLSLTPEAFSRFFKKTTGITFVSFVNITRISKACSLLTHSNHKITDIAYLCGYQNISNFNRQFMKRKGMTPRQFREHHLKLKPLSKDCPVAIR